MKAAQLTKYGEEDAIHINADVKKPSLKTGEVLVEVYAASVNPFDLKVREGQMQDSMHIVLPATLSSDVSGVVIELGPGVDNFELGQKVYGMASAAAGEGSMAEFTAVRATQLVTRPASVDFETAAALPLAGISAYQAIVDHMDLQKGQKILIHGGAGGIGSIAIQIAKNIGACVATTVSSKDIDFVRQLAADEVIDYKIQDFSNILKDFDTVLDLVGGETNEKSYAVLKKGGTLVSLAKQPNEELAKNVGIEYIYQSSQPTVERLAKLAELVDSGAVKVFVDRVFSLNEAPAAYEYLKTGHPTGKVVVSIKD